MEFTKEQQEHVDNLVGLARKEGQDKILKELGFENVEVFKTSQKTQQDELNKYKTENSNLKLKEVKTTKLLEKGLSLDALDLIHGNSEEEIGKQIETLVKIAPKQSEPTPPTPNPNQNTPKGENGDFADYLKWEEK